MYYDSGWKYEPHNLHLSLIRSPINLQNPERFVGGRGKKKKEKTTESWKSQRAGGVFDLSSAVMCIRNMFSTSDTDAPMSDELYAGKANSRGFSPCLMRGFLRDEAVQNPINNGKLKHLA